MFSCVYSFFITIVWAINKGSLSLDCLQVFICLHLLWRHLQSLLQKSHKYCFFFFGLCVVKCTVSFFFQEILWRKKYRIKISSFIPIRLVMKKSLKIQIFMFSWVYFLFYCYRWNKQLRFNHHIQICTAHLPMFIQIFSA